MKLRYFLLFPAVSMGIFAISLMQPAFTCSNQASHLGYDVLLMGWMAILVLDPRWWANVAVLYLWWWVIVPNERLFPKKINYFVLLAAAATVFLPSPVGCPGGAGARDAATGLASGGYLWTAALVVAVIGTFFVRGSGDVDTA